MRRSVRGPVGGAEGRAGAARALAVVAAVALGAGCGSRPAAAPRPTSVTPDRGEAGVPVPVRIRGEGFAAEVTADFVGGDDVVDARFQALLGTTRLEDVVLRQDGVLEATVPAELPAGTHALTIVAPSGRAGTLPQAYRALAATAFAARVARFRVEPVGVQVAASPFAVVVTALDAAGTVVADYAGEARLSDLSGAVVPPSVGLFVDGQWAGTVEVRAAHAADVLTVADAGGASGSSAAFDVVPAPPAAVRFAPGGATAQAGACAGPVTVSLRDAFGSPTTARTPLALSVAAAPAAGFTLHADAACGVPLVAPTVPAGEGSVSFWFVATAAGPLQLTASGAGLAGDAATGAVAPGPPAALAFVSPPRTAAAGACSDAATVQVRDAWGNPAPAGVTLSLAATPAAGLALYADPCGTPASDLAVAPGATAASVWFRGTAAGAVRIVVSGAGLAAAVQDEAVVAGAASALAFSTAPRAAAAGACSAPVEVEVRDAFGNAAPAPRDVRVTLAATPSAGFGLYADAGCTTPAGRPTIPEGGRSATVHFRGTAAGEVAVAATAPSLEGAAQAQRIDPGPPAAIVLTSAPQTVAVQACSGAVGLALRDAFGNPSPAPAAIPVSPSAVPAGPTFRADPSCAGEGPAPGFAAGSDSAVLHFRATAVGAFTLTAAAVGLASASQVETIVAAAATRLAFTTAAQTVPAGSCSGAVTVEARDAWDNPAAVSSTAGTEVSLSAAGLTFHPTAACGGAVTSVTLAPRAATATFHFRGTAAGPVGVTASAPGLSSTTRTETIVAGPLDHFAWAEISSPQLEGVAFAVTVTAADAHGNPVDHAGTVTLSASSGAVACASACTSATETGPLASGRWAGTVVVPAAGAGVTLTASGAGRTGTSGAFDVGGPAPRSPPLARFTASARVITSGNAVTFDASASSDHQTPASALTVSWHFEARDADYAATVLPPASPWTAWSSAKTATHAFINNTGQPVVYRPRLAVRDAEAGPGGPDVGYASGLVVVLPDAGNVCVVDTDSLADDSAGSTSCDVRGPDGALSLAEAIRVANASPTPLNVTFSGARTIAGGGATLSVTRPVRIVASPGAVVLDGVGLVIGAPNVLVAGLELTRLATPLTVQAGADALLEDLHVHDGRGIEVRGRARVVRARMSGCSGGACVREDGASAYLAVFFSDLRGAGGDVGISLDACATATPTTGGSSPYLAFSSGWAESGAAFVAATVLTGFGTAVVFGPAGSCPGPVVTNVTFDGNGTGVRATSGAGGYVLDSIFTRQTVAAMDPAVCALALNTRNVAWLNASDGCVGAGSALTAADPLYVHPSARDHRLRYASPARDAANAGNAIEVDDAGPGYFLGAAPDRGGRETY